MSFEPNRLAETYLIDAYAQVVAVTRRRRKRPAERGVKELAEVKRKGRGQ